MQSKKSNYETGAEINETTQSADTTLNQESNHQSSQPREEQGKNPKEIGKWFSKAMFLQTLNTFSPIPLVYFAMLFLALPMDIFLWEKVDIELTTGVFKELSTYANYGLRMGLPTAFLLGCLNAMMVFRYLCNNRSSNMVHSLPIKREALYVTQYLAGLSFVILPNIGLLLSTFLACWVQGFYYPEPFVIMFLVHCGLYTFFYTFAVFCAMLTGSVGSIFLYFLTFNFIVAFVTLLVQPLLEMFYLGYVGSTFSYPFVRLLTPLYALVSGGSVTPMYQYTAEPMLPGGYFDPYPANISYEIGDVSILIGYAVATVVFLVAGFCLYKARHIETAGEAVAATWLKPVFRFSVGVIGGIAMGIVSTLFVVTSYEDPRIATILPIYALGWCMVFVYLSEMIIQKSFRVLYAWKKSFLSMATVAVVFSWLIFDLGGFEDNIPLASEVESVTLMGIASYPADSVSAVGHITVDSATEDLGEKVVEIHHLLLERAREFVATGNIQAHGMWSYNTFRYNLKGDGNPLERGYRYLFDPKEEEEEGTLAWKILDLVNHSKRQEVSYDLDAILGNVIGVQFTNVYDNENDLIETRELSLIDGDLSSFELEEIREALIQGVYRDFAAGNIGEKFLDLENERYLEEYSSFKLVFSWEKPLGSDGLSNLSAGEHSVKSLGDDPTTPEMGITSVAISHHATHTMEVLEKYDLIKRFEVLTNWEYLEKCVGWYEAYQMSGDQNYLQKLNGIWLPEAEINGTVDPLDPLTYLYLLK